MLEKIGLPAKPSMRGSSWVVDASHCQGCSSQFSFINRKHHCRRCGGIFCGSCTQQRMCLRGQGDSPVRICEPCKKLEEAARFEMRHGHKNKAGKGGSKLTSKHEDEVLNQILGADEKQSFSSGRESISSMNSELDRGASSASCSTFDEEYIREDGKGGKPRSLIANPHNGTLDIRSSSPEELRQQALEEKKKYKILKGEGKNVEALRAFKRGKELEREAKDVEVALRKSQRKALSSSSLSSVMKANDDPEESSRKRKISSQMDKEGKGDLAAELRELGWSDADLHDADKKPAKMSLEGELSSLIGEVHKKPVVGKRTSGINKTEVIALKKKALMFKREGKLAEAKEELKKAKVLEQQLEEQELLGEAEDSDDELSSLIRSMDGDKGNDLSLTYDQDAGFDVDHLVGIPEDIGLDESFDVTDEDMYDPEMAAALTSLGWTEDSEHSELVAEETTPKSVSMDEALSLKKEAVKQKRLGNIEAATTLLRKAKLLERDAESLQSQGNCSIASNPSTQNISTSRTAEKISTKVDEERGGSLKHVDPILPKKSKFTIQKELLALKKKALALRREGRINEAEEELKKGRVLECQLEEMESSLKVRATTVKVGSKVSESLYEKPSKSGAMVPGEEEVDEEDVTEQDMHDPALLSLLENLGWKDEEKSGTLPSRPSKQIGNRSDHVKASSVVQSHTEIPVVGPKRSKAEVQRELLSLKRKALTLRRQGEVEEAEEVLRMAKVLEAQMAEIEAPKVEFPPNTAKDSEPADVGSSGIQEAQRKTLCVQESLTTKPAPRGVVDEDVTEPVNDPNLFSQVNNFAWKDEVAGSVSKLAKYSEQSVNRVEDDVGPSMNHAFSEIPVLAPRSKAEIQRELLGLKRQALTLRRQGKTKEAEEVLKMADILDTQIKEMAVPAKEVSLDSMKEVETGDSVRPKDEIPLLMEFDWSRSSMPPPRSCSIYDAKASRPVELDPLNDTIVSEPMSTFCQSGQSVNSMDLLTGVDWKSSQLSTEEAHGNMKKPKEETGRQDEIAHGKSETAPSRMENMSYPGSDSQKNQSNIQHEILVHKRKAVALKREGKLAEAREELRQAKLLEKSQQEDGGIPDADRIDTSVPTCNEIPAGQEDRKTTHWAPKPITGRDRFKVQQESLGHKRQALKLRREGRMEEAEAEFELAKALEAQLEESSGHHDSSNSVTVGNDDLGVEDFLDPQLLSALKSIGLQDPEIVPQVSDRSEGAKSSVEKTETVSQLEERIKAEKVKAVNLKRAGKQAEALDALRRAKLYEKKLTSLA